MKKAHVFIRRVTVMLLLAHSLNAHAIDLNEGGVVSGSISTAGNQDEYEFQANTGDKVAISVVDLYGNDANVPGDIYPRFYIYQPNGDLLRSSFGSSVAELSDISIPLNGIYKLLVTDYYGTGVGDYEVHYARAPGAVEHGDLVNGQKINGDLTLGDIDSFTFTAKTGDKIALSVADMEGADPNLPGNIYPRFHIYSPTGVRIASTFDALAASVSDVTAPLNGTYTVVLKDYYGTGTGPYELHYARAPGAQEHGGLKNGGKVSESLSLGDIDTYSFYAETGDKLAISVADLQGGDPNLPGDIYPRIYLYSPTGVRIGSNFGSLVARVDDLTAPLNGTYTLVVKDYYATGTGPYEVHYTRAPHVHEHGALANNGTVIEYLDLGDLDSYSFYAQAGDTVAISVSDLEGSDPNLPGDIYPKLYVYRPDGQRLVYKFNALVASAANVSIPLTGTYTAIVEDYYGTGTGPYSIDFTSTNSTTPDSPVLLAPISSEHALKPAFYWDSVGYSDWYYLWVEDLAGSLIVKGWYLSSTAGCSGGDGRCSIISPVDISGSARWWVGSWNTNGWGGWSSPKEFSTNTGVPSASNPLAPTGSVALATPEYSWSRLPDATWYYLWVDDSTGSRIRQWVLASDAGCVESGTTCKYRFDTGVSGNVNWWVRAYNSDGVANWGAKGTFTH